MHQTPPPSPTLVEIYGSPWKTNILLRNSILEDQGGLKVASSLLFFFKANL